jgi:hypothetical protein
VNLIQAGQSAVLSIEPTAQLTDPTDELDIAEVAKSIYFTGGTGQLAGIIACDNAQVLPAGWGYSITVTLAGTGQVLLSFNTFINHASGATQDLSTLTPVASVTTMQGYMPLPSGTATSGQVPVATGTGNASAWGSAGGAVSSVFGRTGAVAAISGDYGVSQVTGAAPLASPALTGSPTAPTQSAGDSSAKIATDAFVAAAVAAAWLPLLLAPTGATGETYPRGEAGGYTAVLTSGTPMVSAIPLPAGLPVNNLGTIIGSTGFASVTHGWLALLDSGLVVRAVTADQSAFGSANTKLSLPVTGAYVTTTTALYYLVVSVVAGTMGTLPIGTAPLAGSNSTAPILAGTSGTGATAPPALLSTMTALSAAGSQRFYGFTA